MRAPRATARSAPLIWPIIEPVLPTGTAWSERFDYTSDVPLYPEEEALLVGATAARRQEFATGRLCARDALGKLGVARGSIGRNGARSPRWPPGIVGSITHCPGYCAAAAARTSDLVTIGIDAEPHRPLPEEVRDRIALPGELEHLRSLASSQSEGQAWDTLLFCAKEAAYKAWYPLTGTWLGFDEASVTIDAARNTFDVCLLVPGPTVNGHQLAGFTGRWAASDALLVGAVAVVAEPA